MRYFITWQRENKHAPIWQIYLNDSLWQTGHVSIFGRFPPRLTADSLEEVRNNFWLFFYQRVKKYTLWRLSRQTYHSTELKNLLQKKLVPLALIEKIIQECVQAAYLNDQTWLKTFITHKQQKHSMRHIHLLLQAKGLSTAQIQAYAPPTIKIDEIETIQKLLKTTYRAKDLGKPKDKHKIITSLLRKGFSFEKIQEACKIFVETTEIF